MPITTPSRMQVVRKEEKEHRLQEFIRSELAEMGSSAAGVPCMLLARSPDSPVARAMSAFAADLLGHAIVPRVIFSAMPASAEAGALSMGWLDSCQLRFARNPQLLDAHELLVVGHAASWIGDSMRRDPMKRDAYESYTRSCSAMAERTARAFDQLWQRSETAAPVQSRAEPAAAVSAEPLPAADLKAPAPVEGLQPPTPGATRH